jgi:hypothetical protein
MIKYIGKAAVIVSDIITDLSFYDWWLILWWAFHVTF